ncbi:glycine cleavage system protein H [Pelomonas sp. CA6]|uniref:glycine cleavage system protein H n=1 Tax=Pelomonas sp. CA6 TaxID=2907999 RepID=UPI001F4A5F04|nr:glycine cleavage system protein H [Pelomonas sp. CA6]MCH7342422.1 glycine cleavage system protein H [Pelomonas sp. CA6]
MLIAGCELPEDLLYWVEDQTWARLLDDGSVLQGITALGLKASGEIYMCRPKAAGARLEQGRSMGVVELAKSIVSVRSPLSGEVLASNAALEEDPGLVHRDPYGAGWLLRLRPTDLAGERAALRPGAEAREAMERYAWLNQLL